MNHSTTLMPLQNKLQKKKMKKRIILFSILGTVLILSLVAVLTVTNYYSVHNPSLKLEKYCFVLDDAESIGIGSIDGSKNQTLLLKKNKNTGKIEPLNFFTKKKNAVKKSASISKGSFSLAAEETSYDKLAKEQDKLGWTVRNYLLYDGFTFVQFVPKPKYFNHVSDGIFYSHEFFDSKGQRWLSNAINYRVNEYNINHYINNQYREFDTWYTWGGQCDDYRGYIIDNSTGLIYALDFLKDVVRLETERNVYHNNIHFYNNALYLVCNFNYPVAQMEYRTDYIGGYPISLSVVDNNLKVEIKYDMPPSGDYFKDRYGQYFAPATVKTMIDTERKINLISESEWRSSIKTSDNRFLIIKNNKLYEYLDNFELAEVPDDVTYKFSGYYSDYSIINNKYLFNFAKGYLTDLTVTHPNDDSIPFTTEFGVIGVLKGDYYVFGDGSTIRCIKNPFQYYEAFKEANPSARIPLLGSYQGEYDETEYNNYMKIIKDNSIVFEDVTAAYVPTSTEWHDVTNYRNFTNIPVDEEIIVEKWTPTGTTKYAIDIDEEGNVVFVELENYVPEQKEIILTPINL